MDMNKILQWMDLAKKYQTTDFWKDIFDQSSFEDLMKAQAGEGTASPFEPRRDKNFPPTDIYMTDSDVLLIAELPGYQKHDIRLSVSGTNLLLKGNSNLVHPGQPLQQERFNGPFERSIQLPEATFPDQIRATFRNGLLLITYKRQFRNEEYVPID
ncbi:Hsp20/alpha crystallin family protein [Fredinandcohnia sp. QZ13]|uniref:Hsp20/alpha crystallin family protein n=1 Tax=Fredinandcohnia sp. QZ13 TaxID=3073144 RepID=UPI0028534EF5|nr:Hsp20/alpha crystallin family protein [Fredinandcohnia sp. QZ13]MDR4886110.1 Hsp20/alpha crystallin family protein [Fredinandcohnia sp. QZ13]